jgi:hypothetical protein
MIILFDVFHRVVDDSLIYRSYSSCSRFCSRSDYLASSMMFFLVPLVIFHSSFLFHSLLGGKREHLYPYVRYIVTLSCFRLSF